MLIAANGKAQAALHAAPLQNDAAIRSGHALAKAMHTHAAPDLGLISTLWHLLTPNN
jgi:hypothetical protein